MFLKILIKIEGYSYCEHSQARVYSRADDSVLASCMKHFRQLKTLVRNKYGLETKLFELMVNQVKSKANEAVPWCWLE